MYARDDEAMSTFVGRRERGRLSPVFYVSTEFRREDKKKKERISKGE